MSVTFAVENPNSDNQRQYPGVDIWPIEQVPRWTNLTFNPKLHYTLEETMRYQNKGCFILTRGRFAIRRDIWTNILSMIFEGPDAMSNGLLDMAWNNLMVRVRNQVNQVDRNLALHQQAQIRHHQQFGTPVKSIVLPSSPSCVAPGAVASKPWTQLPFNVVASILANRFANTVTTGTSDNRQLGQIAEPDPNLVTDKVIRVLIENPVETWNKLLPREWVDAIRHSEFFAWTTTANGSLTQRQFIHLEGAQVLSLANHTCSPPTEMESASDLMERLWRRLTIMAPESDVLVITDSNYDSVQQIPLRTMRFASTS